MLNCELAKVAEDVLHLRIRVGPIRPAQVVEPRDAVHEEVDNGDDDRHEYRVAPHDHHRRHVDPAVLALLVVEHAARRRNLRERVARDPAKDTEDRRQHVHSEDGAHQLPRRQRVGATRDENQPVLRQRHFQEQNLLNVAKVLDDTAAIDKHGTANDPGAGRKQDTENDGDDPDLG